MSDGMISRRIESLTYMIVASWSLETSHARSSKCMSYKSGVTEWQPILARNNDGFTTNPTDSVAVVLNTAGPGCYQDGCWLLPN